MIIANNGRKAAISVDIFGTQMTFTFADGRDLQLDVAKLSPEIQKQAMLHGIKQKLVDAAAISRSLETGRSASIDDKYNAVKEVFDRIIHTETPSWNKRAEGKESSTSTGGNTVFVRAIMRMTGKDKAYVDQWLGDKTKEERAALKKNPRVLAIMAELQGATVVGGVNTDDLLSELGGPTESSQEPAKAPKSNNRKKPTTEPANA
jgi:hypothetical protein